MDKNDYDSEQKRSRMIKRICLIAAIVFATATAGVVIALIVTKLDVLFIPLAICAVFALITLTYAKHAGE